MQANTPWVFVKGSPQEKSVHLHKRKIGGWDGGGGNLREEGSGVGRECDVDLIFSQYFKCLV